MGLASAAANALSGFVLDQQKQGEEAARQAQQQQYRVALQNLAQQQQQQMFNQRLSAEREDRATDRAFRKEDQAAALALQQEMDARPIEQTPQGRMAKFQHGLRLESDAAGYKAQMERVSKQEEGDTARAGIKGFEDFSSTLLNAGQRLAGNVLGYMGKRDARGQKADQFQQNLTYKANAARTADETNRYRAKLVNEGKMMQMAGRGQLDPSFPMKAFTRLTDVVEGPGMRQLLTAKEKGMLDFAGESKLITAEAQAAQDEQEVADWYENQRAMKEEANNPSVFIDPGTKQRRGIYIPDGKGGKKVELDEDPIEKMMKIDKHINAMLNDEAGSALQSNVPYDREARRAVLEQRYSSHSQQPSAGGAQQGGDDIEQFRKLIVEPLRQMDGQQKPQQAQPAAMKPFGNAGVQEKNNQDVVDSSLGSPKQLKITPKASPTEDAYETDVTKVWRNEMRVKDFMATHYPNLSVSEQIKKAEKIFARMNFTSDKWNRSMASGDSIKTTEKEAGQQYEDMLKVKGAVMSRAEFLKKYYPGVEADSEEANIIFRN